MRRLILLVLVVAAALAAAWLGGETWLVREAARRIADDPQIEAAAVTPLRRIDRIGLHLADLKFATEAGPATLPALDLWAAPTAPTTFHATLPPALTLPGDRALALTGGGMSLRVSPGNGMAIGAAGAKATAVTLDGAPLAEGVDVTATLTPMGGHAPKAARASYRVAGTLTQLVPAAVGPVPPALAEAGPIGIDGAAQLYFTGALKPGEETPPRLVGVNSDGVTLHVGAHHARISGHVTADAEGRAAGAAFVDTPDPRGWLDLAAALGAIPAQVVPLATTALRTASGAEVTLPQGITAPPPPPEGTLRITLIFRDGRSFLGPMPIGPAPLFAP